MGEQTSTQMSGAGAAKAEVRRQNAEVKGSLGRGAGTLLAAMYHRCLACAEPVTARPSRSNEAEENRTPLLLPSAFLLLPSQCFRAYLFPDRKNGDCRYCFGFH